MNNDFIDHALRVLLTPDGKGLEKKAHILAELCQTQNPNIIRNKITKLLDDNGHEKRKK